MARTVDLGLWRTPVEPVPRLSAAVGLDPDDLWVKRDDWLGHGGGGNKLRKLAHLLGVAVADGADTVVTTGAAQSNHARLTAAAARRLGLDVVLVLHGDGPGEATGNLALDALFGAEVVWAGAGGDEVLAARAGEVAAERERGGATVSVIPFGGSDGVGARGYVECAAELAEQVPDARHVVVAVGSGGTMAGLVTGLGPERVLGVDTGAVPDPVARVARLVAATATGRTVREDEVRVREDVAGEGYGVLSAAGREAMILAGRHAGIVLDPVYTATAFAGLLAGVRDGAIVPGDRTVFVHTGGLPGLFGHPVAAELAATLG
ncbi:pyridoxal-phosphate dependent enzyme [Patulibacter americanus]|uniref:pyridoxal-phosphate dependent enzyme n=1 Tax=Patulibacter americanus TaxID=588672 RepID=UPI0003B6DFA5|nr:pyridoxal-phosphate dependent enzyme [Patulibacter americanus]